MTVAFVVYRFNTMPRRVGPMELEQARTQAREISRRALVTNVCIEEWACVKTTEVNG